MDFSQNPAIIETEDGSHTLFHPGWGEHFHSIHGAVQESMHVFILNGMNLFPGPALRILEAGFGTGLNAYLSLLKAKEKNLQLQYNTIELFPLPPEIYESLNYPEELTGRPDEEFLQMHRAVWNERYQLNDDFQLHKMHCDLRDFQFATPVDLIYFDAFSPSVQPELWSYEIFTKLFQLLSPGGVFVSYTAKGQVRRDLQKAGFYVERLPGPPCKREMLRGIKKA